MRLIPKVPVYVYIIWVYSIWYLVTFLFWISLTSRLSRDNEIIKYTDWLQAYMRFSCSWSKVIPNWPLDRVVLRKWRGKKDAYRSVISIVTSKLEDPSVNSFNRKIHLSLSFMLGMLFTQYKQVLTQLKHWATVLHEKMADKSPVCICTMLYLYILNGLHTEW